MTQPATKPVRWTKEQAAAHVQLLTGVPCSVEDLERRASGRDEEALRLISWEQLCGACEFTTPEMDENYEETMQFYDKCRCTGARASRDSCPAWRNLKTPAEAGWSKRGE